jgi:hypothetical protein
MPPESQEAHATLHPPTAQPNGTETAPAVQTLDWEHPVQGKAKRTSAIHLARFAPLAAVSRKFNALFPPHKTYLGRSRRTALLIAAGALIVILALAVGLGVGLGKHSK